MPWMRRFLPVFTVVQIWAEHYFYKIKLHIPVQCTLWQLCTSVDSSPHRQVLHVQSQPICAQNGLANVPQACTPPASRRRPNSKGRQNVAVPSPIAKRAALQAPLLYFCQNDTENRKSYQASNIMKVRPGIIDKAVMYGLEKKPQKHPSFVKTLLFWWEC